MKKSGYYLLHNLKVIAFNKNSDESFHTLLEKKFGEWSVKNARKWGEYEIFHIIQKSKNREYYENSYTY